MRAHRGGGARTQQGMTLLIGMLMLLMITIMSVVAFRLGTTNMQVVANEQVHDESLAAANFTLDKVANDSKFFKNYAAAGGTTGTVSVGQDSYTVTVPKVRCLRYRSIGAGDVATQVNGADTVSEEDASCIGSAGDSGGVTFGGGSGGPTGGSMCSITLWEVEVEVTPNSRTGASTVVRGGIEVRDDGGAELNSCQ